MLPSLRLLVYTGRALPAAFGDEWQCTLAPCTDLTLVVWHLKPGDITMIATELKRVDRAFPGPAGSSYVHSNAPSTSFETRADEMRGDEMTAKLIAVAIVSALLTTVFMVVVFGHFVSAADLVDIRIRPL
jgi:hypothetical protein